MEHSKHVKPYPTEMCCTNELILALGGGLHVARRHFVDLGLVPQILCFQKNKGHWIL